MKEINKLGDRVTKARDIARRKFARILDPEVQEQLLDEAQESNKPYGALCTLERCLIASMVELGHSFHLKGGYRFRVISDVVKKGAELLDEIELATMLMEDEMIRLMESGKYPKKGK